MANFNFNKVILGGRMTADPELKTSSSNVPVMQFSIAVNRKGKDAKTDFIECTAFKNTAEFISKYFRKGSAIIIFGSIQVDTWKDKEGHSRKSVKVIVDEVQFGESKSQNSEPVTYSNAPEKFLEVSVDDADLPF
jgi:single-strand DNA-binding protein